MRNLTSQEIVDQVLFWARLMKLMPKNLENDLPNQQPTSTSNHFLKEKDNFEKLQT